MKFLIALLLLTMPKATAAVFSNVNVESNLTMSGKTASTVPYLDASKNLVSSVVTPTELGYVSGVTSAIQTQFSGKEPTITATTAADYFSGAKTFLDFGTSARASLLTGYVSGAGTLAATDTFLQAFNKLNGNILLKRDLADSSAYYVGPVGTGRPYTTISAALTAMGAAVSENDFEQAKIVYISGGKYDENITIPRGRTVTLVAEGTVVLGDGIGANYGSTTARSITFQPDSADIFGSDIKPALNLIGMASNDPTSTFLAEAGGFIISGNINFDGAGVSHTVNLSNTKVLGSLTKTTLGLTNLQGYKLLVVGASNLSSAQTILERCYDCEFDGLLTIDSYNAIINSELKAGMTVTANANTLPPSGIFHSTLFGTYTGPAGMLKLDLASDYFFRANGAALGGAATKVILSPVATAAISGILSSTDFATFNSKQDALVNSAGLAAALSDETGTGLSVFNSSPALAGNPTAPTQTAGDNSTKIATTAYADASSSAAASASVIDSIADADTTHAPSRNATFDALALKESLANKNQNNGYAGLDAGGKILSSMLPNTVMEFQGQWNANTNTPALANGTGNTGDVYRANVAGTTNFGAGGIAFSVGDWAVYNGTIWEYAANSNTVVSVNGQQGVVVLSASDIANTPAGNIAAVTVQAAINELDTEKQFVLTNSAGLASALSDETGTGLSVFSVSPTFTGTPLAPTAAGGTNTTQIATTAFVQQEISSFGAGDVAGPASSVDSEVALFSGVTGKLLKRATGSGVAHLTSGVLSTSAVVLTSEVSGVLPVANGGYTSAQAASDLITTTITNGDLSHAPDGNSVFDALALKADLASPALTGNPTAPTQTANDNSTKIATTAYADASAAAAGSSAVSLISNISGNTTGAGASKTYFGDTSGGGFTFTLPLAASFSGVKFMVKNISIGGANSITIARSGADTIEGGTSDSLAAGESQIYQSNGTSWYVQ